MALRPKIVKLAKMVGGLTGMMNHIDENAPEYYALECVVSDEQADVALQLGLRKERTAEYVAQKCGKSLEETREILMELAQIGVCKVYHNEAGEEVFLVQIFAPGILEMMVNNDEQVKAHPQIGKAFEEYTRLRISGIAPNLPMGTGMMRVIPIETAISADTQSVPYEHLSYYLDKYDTFSVSDCSCRKSRRILGQGCGHLEHEMCIQMGTGAEYYIRTGRARQITRQEAEEILRKAEENGLMHQIPNIEGLGESAAICNCCSCSCFAMRVATMFRSPDAIRSNYVSQVDKEKCVACGQCVENCPTNALRLGQKLCAKQPVKEKSYDKVRDHVWGEKHWNVDYRENREDVAESGTSPCKTACPAHIAVQGYIKLASQGKYTEALELIKKENPFPAVCGRICPRSCESACTRGDIDEPIAIDEIKKFIADQDLNENNRFIPKKRHDYRTPVAVIGSGPSGMSCAYYLALDGYQVTVFEKQEKPGGMLTMGIPGFRLEKNVVEAEIEVLRQLGVHFRTGVEVGKDVTIQQLRQQGFQAFYLAIGAQGGRKLNIPGEDAEGVVAGVDFLRSGLAHAAQKRAREIERVAPFLLWAAVENENVHGRSLVSGFYDLLSYPDDAGRRQRKAAGKQGQHRVAGLVQGRVLFQKRVHAVSLSSFRSAFRFSMAAGVPSVTRCRVSQASICGQSAQVSIAFSRAQLRMAQRWSQKGVFAPSMRQPVQLSISAVIGTPLSFVHSAAVFSRRASSLVIVAIRASHVSQFRPQQAIMEFTGFLPPLFG